MARVALVLVSSLLAVAGCGGDDSSPSNSASPDRDTATKPEPEKAGNAKSAAEGATIALGNSPYGSMLFDSNKQAIYIFEKDPRGETVCYGECAQAWPPVYTDGKPQAGKGVKGSLLGTVKRRDGRLQVTYAGQPLYLYANEGPGEVKCQNVKLNGGFWWVVGPDGKRRA